MTFFLRRMPNHRSVYLGKRVYVKLRDGTAMVSRFKEKNDRHLVLECGRYRWRDVAVFRIHKGEGI